MCASENRVPPVGGRWETGLDVFATHRQAHPPLVLARPAPRGQAAAVGGGVRVHRHRPGAAVPRRLPARGPRVRPGRRRAAARPVAAGRVPGHRAGRRGDRPVRRAPDPDGRAGPPGRVQRAPGLRRDAAGGGVRADAVRHRLRRHLAGLPDHDRDGRPGGAAAALLRRQLHAAQPRHRDRRHRRRVRRRRRPAGDVPVHLPRRRDQLPPGAVPDGGAAAARRRPGRARRRGRRRRRSSATSPWPASPRSRP